MKKYEKISTLIESLAISWAICIHKDSGRKGKKELKGRNSKPAWLMKRYKIGEHKILIVY